MGIIHNECLDFVYNEMVQKRFYTKSATLEYSNLFKDKERTMTMAAKYGVDYLKSKYIQQTKSAVEIEVNIDDIIAKKGEIIANGFRNDQLSKLQIEFLNGILRDFSIILNHDLLMSEITSWEERIFSAKMTQEEKESVLSALLIGKHSLQYWKENHLKWTTLFNSELISISTTTRSISHNHESLEPGSMHPSEDITKFYVSQVNGECIELQCPNNLIFDPQTMVCNFPSEVDASVWIEIAKADLEGAILGIPANASLLTAFLASLTAGITQI